MTLSWVKAVTLDGTSTMKWLEDRSGSIEIKCKMPKIKKSNKYCEAQIPDIFVKLMYNGYCIGYTKFRYNLETKKATFSLAHPSMRTLIPDGGHRRSRSPL